MTPTAQRTRLRAVLADTRCLSPASVFDPLSARIAQSVGYEIAILPGSDASATTLAAPDIILLTLTEFADQARRILRACDLSLFADADHGYGNALNVMRTVDEFEHAGVAGLSIEDTVLPTPFGPGNDKLSMISIEEATGKMRAALAARRDPALVIAARTSAFRAGGIEAAVQRARAYAATGVDALYIVGFKTLQDLDAIHAATPLPLILGSAPDAMKREDLAARGARLLLRGHHEPVAGVAKTLHDIYRHLFADGAPAALRDRVATDEFMEKIIAEDEYRAMQQKYLR